MNDPQWDHQLDSRGEYYARLILAKRLPVRALARQLKRDDDADRSTSRTWCTLDTLGALARRGHPEAIAALREYVATGCYWEDALRSLRETGERSSWDGLDDVLAGRFRDSDDLYRDLRYPPEDELPWSEWVTAGGPIAEAIAGREQRDPGAQARREADLRAMNTADLLDLAERERSPWQIAQILAERQAAPDTALILAAVDLSRPWAATAALSALRRRGDARAFGSAVRIIERWDGRWTAAGRRVGHPAAVRVAANLYLEALPAEVVMPLARRWRGRRERGLRHTAHGILRRHATAEDLPWIRRRLTGPVTDGRIYTICGLAEMIARFPGTGPHRRLRWLYREFPYSFGRRFLVEAMAATDPAFPSGLAYECLWDCEPSTREIACVHVNAESPGARNRLMEMADDPFEGDSVIAAARSRL